MAKNNTITLFDLQLSTGATISPFVWATKYALAHKGFDIDIVPGGFTGIMERTNGRSERLPAIVDDGEWVLDSNAPKKRLDGIGDFNEDYAPGVEYDAKTDTWDDSKAIEQRAAGQKDFRPVKRKRDTGAASTEEMDEKGKDAVVVLPDRDVFLGPVRPGQAIVMRGRPGPDGSGIDVEVLDGSPAQR